MRLPEAIQLPLKEGSLSVRLKPNKRARRLILRLDPKSGDPVATVPPGLSEARIRTFLMGHRDWLIEKCEQQPKRIAFSQGAIIPFRGELHRLVHVGQRRGTIRILEQDGEKSLLVSGDLAHMGRRTQDWLKKMARQDLTEAVDRHARQLQVTPAAIRIKDTTSRWGSCSSTRVLSFSWRIILAPPDVLDYLAAHEVAHLREMNHSPRFWALVNDLCPEYEASKVWLRREGQSLHAYGK